MLAKIAATAIENAKKNVWDSHYLGFVLSLQTSQKSATFSLKKIHYLKVCQFSINGAVLFFLYVPATLFDPRQRKDAMRHSSIQQPRLDTLAMSIN